METPSQHGPDEPGIDARVGNRLIVIKTGVAALRSVRLGLMQLAYALTQKPGFKGLLVLAGTSVTRKRLQHEWQQADAVLRPEVGDRLGLYILNDGNLSGIPRDPDPKTTRIILDVAGKDRNRDVRPRTRPDAPFVLLKILMLHWLTDGKPTTVAWLSRVAGFSYPTVASVLKELGSLVERRHDRKIRLRWFPREEFAGLLAAASRARRTVCFADRSGKSRTAESHLRRLEKLNPPGIALGGVIGAKHYAPDLDLVGTPRLDISLHCPQTRPDLAFIEKLDPALKRIPDPREPATVVVHIVRQADPFFVPRKGGLHWADPMECLLDLHEAGLRKQATEFLAALTQNRPVRS